MGEKIEIIAATAMLLSVAKADETIDNNEIESINSIISDFFQITSIRVDRFSPGSAQPLWNGLFFSERAGMERMDRMDCTILFLRLVCRVRRSLRTARLHNTHHQKKT